jgi:polysaccharide biosynthesis/export protein
LTWLSRTIIFSLLAVMGCAVASPKPQGTVVMANSSPAFEKRPKEENYQLRPGDVLDVKFFHTPELNESVTIRPDGKIALQLIEEIEAIGLTPRDLMKRLQERYAKVLVSREVSVIVRTFAGQKVFVGGEVNAPGVISFDGQPTLLQALIQAGWLKRSAHLENVVIIRNTGGSRPDVLFIDVQESLAEPERTSPIVLQPFDVVYVPKTTVTKVNDFIQQYIDDPILTPISRVMGFSFFYDIRGVNVDASAGAQR